MKKYSKPSDADSKDDQTAENGRLKRELARVAEVRDILKKVTVTQAKLFKAPAKLRAWVLVRIRFYCTRGSRLFCSFPTKLTATTIGRDALVRNPDVWRDISGLEKHVYRNAATGVPVSADPQPFGLQQIDQSLADRYGTILVKCPVIPE